MTEFDGEEAGPGARSRGAERNGSRPWVVLAVAAITLGLGIVAGVVGTTWVGGGADPIDRPPAGDAFGSWDPETARHVGSYRTASLWLAEGGEGDRTCLVVDDPTGSVRSGGSCKPTEDFEREGFLETDAVLEDSEDVASVQLRVQVDDTGARSLTVTEKRRAAVSTTDG